MHTHLTPGPISRRQLGRLALATGALALSSRALPRATALDLDALRPTPLAPSAPPARGAAVSLRFPEGATTAHEPAAVRFLLEDGSTHDVAATPSAHGRDGDFPVCSELIAVPEDAVSVECDPGVSAHLRQPWAELAPASSGSSSDAEVAPGLRVVSREQWGADESLMTWPPEYGAPACLTVHHTFIPSGREPEYQHDWAAAVRGIYRFHSSSDNGGRGWGDIGYHLLIDPEGTVYQGRTTGTPGRAVFDPAATDAGSTGPRVVTAGHVYKANTGNIGVCLIGDFTSEPPTRAALDSLVTVLGALCRELGLDPLSQVRYTNPASSVDLVQPTISGHHDWEPISEKPIECPGDRLWRRLPEVRESVAEILETEL
ncbi:peptidoglycan recognition family protein [Corynebacterium mastitidis]|uniref:Peptidoglycan recognition family protein n=1 Tax=Corynebacterium mastitidis TaxID=161890 RepID=A0ABU8NV36_9CORY